MGSVNTILQANNITRVARARYRNATQTQDAANRREAARVTLGEFSRTLGNQLRMEAAGKEYNYAINQLSHELEQSGKARLNNQLQFAEARGALAAQAGTFGVGGSSVELMDTLTDLQAATKEEQLRRGVELMAINGKRQTAQIVVNAAGSQDFSRTFGSFDYTQHIAPKRMKQRFGKLIAVAVATYFGGPQAGEAVADLAVSDWHASNGDFNGAGQFAGKGMANAGQAWQQWNDRGGQSWFSAVRGNDAGKSSAGVDTRGDYNLWDTGSTSGWGGWRWG